MTSRFLLLGTESERWIPTIQIGWEGAFPFNAFIDSQWENPSMSLIECIWHGGRQGPCGNDVRMVPHGNEEAFPESDWSARVVRGGIQIPGSAGLRH